MELSEVDIKQSVPVDDFLASHSPGMSIDAKFKQSRYEDVWPDDVHAAFMEVRALFLEPSPLPSDYHGIAQTGAIVGSQYILGNLSPSASFLKTEFDPTFDLRSTAAGSDNSSAFTYSSKVPSSICGVSMTFHNQPSSVFAQEKFSPQQGPTGAVPPSGSA
ncbi:hypothetical protein PAXINDRAFT_182512, partial [Paxillus involutus ATCC 200175]